MAKTTKSPETKEEPEEPSETFILDDLANKRTVRCDYCEKVCPPGTAVTRYGNTSRRKFYLCAGCAYGQNG